MKELSYCARLTAISRRLASDQLFGAGLNGHRFEATVHSGDEIALFEEQLGVRLPEEYVWLLTEAGSGAGPYYVLLAPGRVLAEIESLNEVLSREGRRSASPSAPFPFSAI
jgi:hypothetical protein